MPPVKSRMPFSSPCTSASTRVRPSLAAASRRRTKVARGLGSEWSKGTQTRRAVGTIRVKYSSRRASCNPKAIPVICWPGWDRPDTSPTATGSLAGASSRGKPCRSASSRAARAAGVDRVTISAVLPSIRSRAWARNCAAELCGPGCRYWMSRPSRQPNSASPSRSPSKAGSVTAALFSTRMVRGVGACHSAAINPPVAASANSAKTKIKRART